MAYQAAIAAGHEIMRIYNDPLQDFCVELKADDSPLTLADKASHACIMRQLRKTGIPILSEEGKQPSYEVRRSWRRLWVVDPLDGTKEFLKKNGEFTVNVALVDDGRPVVGAIFVPAQRVLYCGAVGFGAWRAVKETDSVAPSISMLSRDKSSGGPFSVVASRSHLTPETMQFISQLRLEHPDLKLVSSGSSLKFCLVAEGSAAIYPRFAPTMEWDTAAGDAIVRAAGHEVVDAHTGEPLTYNKPDLHNPWFIAK